MIDRSTLPSHVKIQNYRAINDYMSLEGLALRVVPYKSRGVKEGGVAYSGSVNSEEVYDNVMNDWKWGNFDKKRSVR